MLPLAYSVSDKLRNEIKNIEILRKRILLAPLSPKSEMRIKWEATVSRTYWSLVLSANPYTRNQMAKLLSTSQNPKTLNKNDQEVVNYKNTLNYIATEWLVTTKPISINTLNTLFNLSCKKVFPQSANNTNKHKAELNTLLDYLNTSNDHPVIQAAIAQIQLVQIAPFKDGNGRIARLIAYLYLYRSGYDFRGLLVFDEYLRRDIVALKDTLERTTKAKNLTLWIEYFAKGIRQQLTKALETVETNKFITDISKRFWKLNQRQKQILFLLDEPASKITNNQVQREFKISQITASRDLAKLASLNLVFSHGKGRATYYTKA